MVIWGHGRMERWRCPACFRIRRKDYHAKVEIVDGAPRLDAKGNPESYLEDPDMTLYHGDALETLRSLPDEAIDCVVTSPPYWGLRDYGVDGQIGLEKTPNEYVAAMVTLFREVRRVLTNHGTCWINLGDSYASGNSGERIVGMNEKLGRSPGQRKQGQNDQRRSQVPGFKPKDLIGIPWRVAFALQADGWYLRSDIIWSKPNPMPESVTDRPTKSHEYVFLMTKAQYYYFDREAVKEAAEWARWGDQTVPKYEGTDTATGWMKTQTKEELQQRITSGRNIRTVWQIPPKPYPGAHFATFPEELVRRCVMAGCPTRVCLTCGKPSDRIVERTKANVREKQGGPKSDLAAEDHRLKRPLPRAKSGEEFTWDVETVGWTDCGHGTWRPGMVLDMFAGSGTTLLAARNEQRHSIGIELNEDYCKLAAERLQQLSLLT